MLIPIANVVPWVLFAVAVVGCLAISGLLIVMCRRHGGCDKALHCQTKETAGQESRFVTYENTEFHAEVQARRDLKAKNAGGEYEDLQAKVGG